MMDGIVLVSHSLKIAQGLSDLLSQVARDVPITLAGGTADGGIGTDFEKISEAVAQNPADRILAFFDLGSARMNLDMAADFSDKDLRIYQVPLIEGAYAAAALLEAGVKLEEIEKQLKELEITK